MIAPKTQRNSKNCSMHMSWKKENSYESIYNISIWVSPLGYCPRVPLVVSCCKFLKFIILKTFNETVLAFLSVESKTNIFYVSISFTGNLLLEFGRYCGKAVPEPTVFHLVWAPALKSNAFSIFFLRWPAVSDSRNKKMSAFLLYFIGFETINFHIFFIKMSCLGSNLFL